MGSGASEMQDKQQGMRSRRIDAELKLEEELSSKTVKLLLLGASDCGKSTVTKQMRILHGGGFSSNEQAQEKSIIYINVIESMKAIVQAMRVLCIEFADQSNEPNAQLILQMASSLQHEDFRSLPADAVAALKLLWQDRGVRRCFRRSSEYELNESTKYFFDDLDRICVADYTPSDQDILRARVKTTGVIEAAFQLKEFHLRVVDVGGQRSERKKWIHCFDSVKGVIFISSLSEYDQNLSEDHKVNRMHESLTLFEATCNNVVFAKASMILFLNKKDRFQEKLRKVPITVAFRHYEGPQEYEACIAYISARFQKLNLTNHEMYVHETCATDTKQMEFVIDAAIDTIISANLKTCGV